MYYNILSAAYPKPCKFLEIFVYNSFKILEQIIIIVLCLLCVFVSFEAAMKNLAVIADFSDIPLVIRLECLLCALLQSSIKEILP
jgi:hypothetical protein